MLSLAFASIFTLIRAELPHGFEVQRCCIGIPKPHVPGATVLSVTSVLLKNHTVNRSLPTLTTDVHGLDVCEVNVTISHTGSNDSVRVQSWLPLNDWNGRFVAVGGGAWLAGQGAIDLAGPVMNGYASASTDAGLTAADPLSPAGWALDGQGKVDTNLLQNFASRSAHDMAIIGKAVVTSFYGTEAKYSYWSGWSTGGRQGVMAAQQYPDDFDGILAGSPAIYWTEYLIAELWPQVLMHEAQYFPPACELDAVLRKAIDACDASNAVHDGVVSDPFQCRFNPFSAIGSLALCDGYNASVSKETAIFVQGLWDGPRSAAGIKLWPGLPIGANLNDLSGTTKLNDTNGPAIPFFVADTWVKYFVKANPKFDTTKLNRQEYDELFSESKVKYNKIIGSANPDLSGFSKSGGKLLVWHGMADQLIYPQDSIKYYHDVERNLGNKQTTSSFFRLFLAPGVDHCGYGSSSFATGAVPSDPLSALVSWVEKGLAPDWLLGQTLPTARAKFSRPICRYPAQIKYVGFGDTTKARNYVCV